MISDAFSGVGRTTAIECSKLGAVLTVTGRNRERLEETLRDLEGDGHKTFLADLTVREDIEALVGEVNCLGGIVLCARQRTVAPFEMSKKGLMELIFEVNYFLPVELLRLLVCGKNIKEDCIGCLFVLNRRC